jgi:UDP-N-acetylmuramyl pentapeptide phosphotransferase/UDP-N-acetylglucosamine-1-phosphate transferase
MYLTLLIAFMWALVVSLFTVPSVIHISHTKKLLDEPNHRTIHEMLTPRLGGLAIFAGFMSAVTIFGKFGDGVQQLLAGCIVMFFIGIKDDIISVSAFKKFFVQIIATFIVMFMGNVRITSLQGFLGLGELEMGASYAFTFLVIIGITNAINLIDGLDGLAGSIIMLILLCFGTFFYYHTVEYAFVAFCLAGGILGFLRYNAYKASIFMGDTGSLLSGFVIAVLAVKFMQLGESGAIFAAPAKAVSILFIPVFDTLRVFTLRIAVGRSPFHPDRNHLHHRFLAMGLPQVMVVVVMLMINLGVIIGTIWFSDLGNTTLLFGQVVLALLISLVLTIVGRYQSTNYAKA